ncbi:MAG: SGNH/GDSL hydrolase family protein [Oscillospiraceae bacterium]|nr:SGNH/GDSL hydrolase family protein [Oscillospiraceae bacterium]
MKILMLGNSFTNANDLPGTLAKLLDAHVEAHARGGATLAEQLNPETELGGKTARALKEQSWDYIVLQEDSTGSFRHRKAFMKTVAGLCAAARENGATPVLYETWPFREGSEKLKSTGLSYEEMRERLFDAYREAGEANGAPVAFVGESFYNAPKTLDLYTEDDHHPSVEGSRIAAETIAETIRRNEAK